MGEKLLIVHFPGGNGKFEFGPASEAALKRRANELYDAGGKNCVYTIGGEPLNMGPTLQIAPKSITPPKDDDVAVNPEVVGSARGEENADRRRRRLPTSPVTPRDSSDVDEVVRSSFRVTEMQHECIARTLETTQKTHELINELNNSFANERLSLFRLRGIERKGEVSLREVERESDAPGGLEAALGLVKMIYGHFKKDKK